MESATIIHKKRGPKKGTVSREPRTLEVKRKISNSLKIGYSIGKRKPQSKRSPQAKENMSCGQFIRYELLRLEETQDDLQLKDLMG